MATLATRTADAPLSWAARMFRCSRQTVLRMIEQGLVEGYQLRPNGYWRVDRDSVLRYLASRKRK